MIPERTLAMLEELMGLGCEIRFPVTYAHPSVVERLKACPEFVPADKKPEDEVPACLR